MAAGLAVLALALVILFATRGARPAASPAAAPATLAAVPTPAAPLAPPAQEAVATVVPARLAFDLEHSMKQGRVRVWAAEKLLLDERVQAKGKTHLVRTFDVPAGNLSVRVDVLWDDNRKSETTSARLKAGATRRLEARFGGLLKRLSLDWR